MSVSGARTEMTLTKASVWAGRAQVAAYCSEEAIRLSTFGQIDSVQLHVELKEVNQNVQDGGKSCESALETLSSIRELAYVEESR